MPTNTKNVKIEVHLLQNFAPSCLNRDETNTPKDCEFGGYRRARISSQCFKFAVRQKFREQGKLNMGERTKVLKQELIRRLSGSTIIAVAGDDLDQQLMVAAENMETTTENLSKALNQFIETYYAKFDAKDKAKNNTEVLLFLSNAEIDAAEGAFRDVLKKSNKSGSADKAIKEQLEAAGLTADIALFGRMLAQKDSALEDKLNTFAACQVAHSISTHAVDLEMDFYSAVDDLSPKIDSGMLGVLGYNSACFYRYALLDRNQLVCNLGDAHFADTVIEAFLDAFTHAIPRARKNGTAPQNLPSFGMFVVRDGSGTPVSLTNAFADPVGSDRFSDKLKDRSVAALAYYWTRMNEVYGTQGVASAALFFDGEIDNIPDLAVEKLRKRREERKQVIESFLDASDKGSVAAAIAATMDAVRKAAGA
jgi:CRISPR system Cascade subunit CasC